MLTALLLLVAVPLSSRAEGDLLFKSGEFDLVISADFERVEHQQAALLLRNKTQGYPTFNTVISAGAWPHSKLSIKEQAQKIEDSYRLVGLGSTKLLNYSLVKLNQQVSLNAELKYQSGASSFTSSVWLVGLPDRHLVFTAVYKDPPGESDFAQVQKIISSIKLKGPAQSAFDPISEDGEKIFTPLLIIGALCALGVGLVAMNRVNRKKT